MASPSQPVGALISDVGVASMGCGTSRSLAQRLEGLDGEAARALVAKEVQKGLAARQKPRQLVESRGKVDVKCVYVTMFKQIYIIS